MPSEDLIALFDGVRSISVAGEPKFSPRVQQELARMVAGRAYAPLLLQLCHLIRIAGVAPRQRVELFFWGIPVARASGYAGWVRARLGAVPRPAMPLAADGAGVTLSYPDGHFAVAYGAMPLLVAVMDFLVAALGYPAVLERIDTLLVAGTRAGVGEVANDLSRAVYAFLAPHLPSTHDSRRFQRLAEHMLRRNGGDFSRDDIDDAAILDLWLTSDDPDDRVYATALRGFLRLADAMEHAATSDGVDRAHPIGTDPQAGEVEPDTDTIPPPGADDAADPILDLQEPPAADVKLLNLRERTELAPMVEAGGLAARLALSLLRERVFGALQARLTEASRRGGAARARHLLDTAERPERYADWIERYGLLDEHVARVMLASLHVLAQAGRAESLHLILACAPAIDLTVLGTSDIATLLRALADPATAGADLAALMLRARRAYRSIARAGFEPDAAERPAVVDGHAAAAAPLVALATRLMRFRAALRRLAAPAWDARFTNDEVVFIKRFRTLYSTENLEAT